MKITQGGSREGAGPSCASNRTLVGSSGGKKLKIAVEVLVDALRSRSPAVALRHAALRLRRAWLRHAATATRAGAAPPAAVFCSPVAAPLKCLRGER
jgi:hypothetical protein